MSRFADVKDKIVFAEEEEAILKYWEEIDAFQTSIKLSEGKPEYTFYDGPPFATGLPHYGYVFCCVLLCLDGSVVCKPVHISLPRQTLRRRI